MHHFSYPKVTEIRHVRQPAPEPAPTTVPARPRSQRELVQDSLLRHPGPSRGSGR